MAYLFGRPAAFGKCQSTRIRRAAKQACPLEGLVAFRPRGHQAGSFQCVRGADIPVNSVGRTLRVFIHDPTCCEFLKLVRTPHRAAGSHHTPMGTALFPAANAFMTLENWCRPALDATIGFSTFTPPDEPSDSRCAQLSFSNLKYPRRVHTEHSRQFFELCGLSQESYRGWPWAPPPR